MKLNINLKNQSTILFLGGFLIVFLTIVFGIVIYGGMLSQKKMLEAQKNREAAPLVAEKRQVKRVVLKKTLENGDILEIELLADGTVAVYKNGKLIKTGLKGFSRIDGLFDLINKNFDGDGEYAFGSGGGYTLTIETNKGTNTIIVNDGDDEGDGDLDDAIEEIENIGDEVINPTPVPTPGYTPPTTPTPSPSNSPTPTPDGSNNPTPTPSPTPGEETELPEYMTRPPFTCADYPSNKPITISNIICGVGGN